MYKISNDEGFTTVVATQIEANNDHGDNVCTSSTHVQIHVQLPFITRHTIVAGYYGFTLDVCVSVSPSVRQSVVRPSARFRFRMIT